MLASYTHTQTYTHSLDIGVGLVHESGLIFESVNLVHPATHDRAFFCKCQPHLQTTHTPHTHTRTHTHTHTQNEKTSLASELCIFDRETGKCFNMGFSIGVFWLSCHFLAFPASLAFF